MSSDGITNVLPLLGGNPERTLSESEQSKGEGTDQNSILLRSRPSLSDEALLNEAAEGSKDAIGLLFRRYRRVVYNVARRILRDDREAEDLCQDVFIYLFQKARIFDASKGRASSWIVQIAYHRAMNRRAYLDHRQHYDTQELNEDHISSDGARLFINELAAKELLERLRDKLSPQQQVIVELHFFEGYSLREIAEKTGQTLASIRGHYYRGLERLRSIVFPEKNSW